MKKTLLFFAVIFGAMFSTVNCFADPTMTVVNNSCYPVALNFQATDGPNSAQHCVFSTNALLVGVSTTVGPFDAASLPGSVTWNGSIDPATTVWEWAYVQHLIAPPTPSPCFTTFLGSYLCGMGGGSNYNFTSTGCQCMPLGPEVSISWVDVGGDITITIN